MLKVFLLWLQIIFFENGGMEKIAQIYLKALAQFMQDAQLNGIIRTVDDIPDRGFRYSAFYI